MANDLSPIESEFATQEEADSYRVWFRAKVEKSLASTEPRIPHEEVMREMREIIKKYAPDLEF